MKKLNVLTLVLSLIVGVSLSAQFDDLYYVEDDNIASSVDVTSADAYDSADYGDYDNADYDNYDYYSEYDNYYSSRIRRFNRPVGTGYYNSYNNCSIAFDPITSYYSPSYLVFDRLSRSYVRTGVRVGRGFVSSARPFGFYNPYIGTTRIIGTRPGFGGLASRGGGYNCPVGAPIASRVTQPRVINPRTTSGSYNGTRRASATRTTTGYRGGTRTNARTGVRSSTAPRTRSTTRSTTRPRISTTRPSTSRSTSRSSSTRSSSNSRFRNAAKSTFKSSSSRGSSRSSRSSSRRGGR